MKLKLLKIVFTPSSIMQQVEQANKLYKKKFDW